MTEPITDHQKEKNDDQQKNDHQKDDEDDDDTQEEEDTQDAAADNEDDSEIIQPISPLLPLAHLTATIGEIDVFGNAGLLAGRAKATVQDVTKFFRPSPNILDCVSKLCAFLEGVDAALDLLCASERVLPSNAAAFQERARVFTFLFGKRSAAGLLGSSHTSASKLTQDSELHPTVTSKQLYKLARKEQQRLDREKFHSFNKTGRPLSPSPLALWIPLKTVLAGAVLVPTRSRTKVLAVEGNNIFLDLVCKAPDRFYVEYANVLLECQENSPVQLFQGTLPSLTHGLERYARYLDIRYKRGTVEAREADPIKQLLYEESIADLGLPMDAFIFIDESGFSLRNFTRMYIHCAPGLRKSVKKFFVRGKRLSLVAALDVSGIFAWEIQDQP